MTTGCSRWAATLLAAATLPALGCALPEPIRVMTFNIRYGTAADGPNDWQQRRGLVFETIRSWAPDVLGLQEVLAFQAEELVAALPGYGFVGVGRQDGARRGEFCPIMFRKSRFDLVQAGHFWLSQEPRRPGSIGWDAALPRIVTWVRLRLRRSVPDEIQVLNVHFDHRGQRARLESARLLRRLVEARAGTPLIVLGDFNCGPDSEPYRVLTCARGNLAELRDPYVRLGLQERGAGTYHGFSGDRGSRRIDWILHNRRFESTESAIQRRSFNGRYPSDHFPVTARLRLLPATARGAL